MSDLLLFGMEGIGFFPTFLQTLVKGLALGSIYAILGLGFVIVFKGTQVLNFASGGIAMAGAIFMSILIADGGIPFYPEWLGNLPLFPDGNPIAPGPDETPGVLLWVVHLLMALVFAALLAMFLERVAIRPMVGQPLFSMAVITLGLETAIGPFNRDATAINARSLKIPWKLEQWTFMDAGIPKSYIASMIAAAVCFTVVNFFFRSRFGVAMRAVAFDQEAAQAQGINVGRVFSIAWGLGAALCAVAAIFYGMGPFPPQGLVSQEIHPVLAFRVLPVIILGGLDSVPGALYGGLMIATAEVMAGQYLASYTSILGAGYSTIVPYIVMIIVLLVKPYGLFGTEEIRRV